MQTFQGEIGGNRGNVEQRSTWRTWWTWRVTGQDGQVGVINRERLMPGCVLHSDCCWHSLALDISSGRLKFKFKSQFAVSGMTLKRLINVGGVRQGPSFPAELCLTLARINGLVSLILVFPKPKGDTDSFRQKRKSGESSLKLTASDRSDASISVVLFMDLKGDSFFIL